MAQLFDNENLELVTSPSLFSWLSYYLKALSYFFMTILVLWFYQTEYMVKFMEWLGYQNSYILTLVIWSLLIVSLNLFYSIHHIKLGYLLGASAVIMGFVFMLYKFDIADNWESILLAYTLVISVLLLIGADVSRVSHIYTLTNKRIILKGGIAKKDEREIGYESITDLGFKQGLFGRMLDFGNLTPVTQSGMGIETKTSGAGGGVVKNFKSWGFFGVFGGSKTTQEIGGRTYYIMYGVKPFKSIKELIEAYKYERSSATQQEKQFQLTESMADNLSAVRQKLAPRVLFCPLRETEVEETMCDDCPQAGTCEYYKNLNKG